MTPDNGIAENVLQNPVVALIEQVLVAAKRGEINSIGIIGVAPGGPVTTAFVGQRFGDLYVGGAMFQSRILNVIMTPAKAPGLVRATGLP